MGAPGWRRRGAFRLAIMPPTPALRLVAWGTNLRARFGQLPYGDQALFMPRQVFEALGATTKSPSWKMSAWCRPYANVDASRSSRRRCTRLGAAGNETACSIPLCVTLSSSPCTSGACHRKSCNVGMGRDAVVWRSVGVWLFDTTLLYPWGAWPIDMAE